MDTSLKQRLIGAIVLVALAVIFLPMLVTGPARNSTADSVPLEVPGAPANAQFETRELPLAAPAGGNSGLGGAAPLQEPATGAPPVVDTSPAVAAGDFAVSFGAYASKADADAVIAHLKGAQLPGFSEQTTISGKQAWRVRVGPFADRAQAESARLQAVKIRSDVRAEVVTLDAAADSPAAATATARAPAAAATTAPLAGNPVQTQALPERAPAATPRPAPKPVPAPAAETKAVAAKVEPKPAAKPAATPAAAPEVKAPAAPAASGVGFAVQLGAFAQTADANALRDKARAAGFSAIVDQVRTDKGTLSRVRVGPVASRAEADQLKAQVASRIGVAGMVRPHP